MKALPEAALAGSRGAGRSTLQASGFASRKADPRGGAKVAVSGWSECGRRRERERLPKERGAVAEGALELASGSEESEMCSGSRRSRRR